MSSKADAWFVPDQKFHASRMDYAVVSISTPQIRFMTSAKDKEVPLQVPEEITTFRDELYYSSRDPCYPFATRGELLYADVDEENPEHKKQIYGVWAKEELLNKESEKVETARETLLEHLASKSNIEDFENPSERYETAKEALEHDALHCGNIDPTVIDYILSASQEDKELLLSIVSAQTRRKTQRPVLILVGIVEDTRKPKAGMTEGWVVGYDFVKNLIIIKPFFSKEDHHLFGEKWDCPVAKDGISFSGSPKVFTTEFVEFAEALDDKSVDGGFKMLMYAIVAKWILRQWGGLSSSDVAYFNNELQDKLKKAVTDIKETMNDIKFPVNSKPAEEKVSFEPFRWMREMMEVQEAGVRDAAVQAKDDGHSKMAENAAEVFGRLMDQLKAFNEDPEGDL